MRELTGHKVNPANDVLKVMVIDEPGAGGANHRYEISGFDPLKNQTWVMWRNSLNLSLHGRTLEGLSNER